MWWVGLALVAWWSVGAADAVPNPLDKSFDEAVEDALSFFNVPALSIAIVDGNETFAKGYGTAVFPSTPATADTLYYVGSTTKSFTAAAMLLLIEDSANSSSPLSLTTPVSELIRAEFVLPDEYATRKATLEDLLTHRTGMPRHEMSYGGPRQPSLKQLVRNLRHLPMTRDLRAEFQYCNMMYGALSYVIEQLAGTSLADFFRQRIWAPLGMHNTFLSLADAQRHANASRLSRGYAFDNATRAFVPTPYMDSPVVAGAAAAISSVTDFARYLRALLARDTRFLTRASYGELRTPRLLAPETDLTPGAGPSARAGGDYAPFSGPGLYGLGWMQQNYRNATLVHHSGGVTGYGAQMAYVPALGWGVALMANTEVTGFFAATALLFRLLDERLGVPLHERFDWQAEFAQALQRKRDAVARTKDALYPGAANATTPFAHAHALPLAAYAGTYASPGYGSVAFAVSDRVQGGRLLANVEDRVWPHQIELEHVAGEHFVAWANASKDSPSALFLGLAMRATFRVGGDRVPVELGLQYEEKMGDELIWFRRVE
ncbi:uncharacterized protein K452DRAFT_317568 [Aplosporella prunicola CBS 121167]|uniref:Beta-lactamase-related domain-containing protein n=1 Tax=Aplosporella prunicola CBS 121167 TaxID=1176127 RepID=A0A6A6BHF4_9PEZI|nr:uncharacterized protein K452DRAFT_317568 [Aplosporella prunicola CBS 121167]KAF2143426.1 hypothetical protein K452DRAFT_317568 [Aplosporella prunicola CBS 121167]